MYERLGRVLVRRAKLVLGLSLVAFIALLLTGVSVFGNLLGEGFADPDAQSTRAAALVDQKFGGEPDLVFVVHARTGSVEDPQATADANTLVRRLQAEPTLNDITSYFTDKAPGLRSADGTDALVLAKVAGADDAALETNAAKILDSYVGADTASITVDVGGPLGTDIGGQVGKDLALAEAIAVPLVLILLLLAFGSLVAALLPLVVALFAVAGTFATLNLLTTQVSVSIFAINLATALGLGLGVDYALFMVSRYREELASGRSVEDAVLRTVRTAGRTIAFSAVTVAVALAALLVFPVYFLKSFAYAGVSVTLFAALAALIILPAALAVLGRRVNAGRLPWADVSRGADAPLAGRIAAAVMRRPVFAALPVIAILVVSATPLLGVTFGTPDDRVLHASASSHRAGDALREKFTSNDSNPVDILVTGTITTGDLTAYAQRISALPNVLQVRTSFGTFTAGGAPATPQAGSPSRQGPPLTSGDTERLEAVFTGDPVGAPAQELVKQIRAVPAPASAAELVVGGTTASLIDAKSAISSKLPLAGAIIILTTLFVMFLFTGSVVQPLRALLSNALVLGATLGIMVAIFQYGYLRDLLNFTPTATDSAMPVLLFCIAFGLATDYEVFLLSRIKEERANGATTDQATVVGLTKAGRIIGTAAGLLAVSFFAFGTAKVSFLQLFGLGTGLAVVLDAVLVRLILLPAFSRLAGEHAWWAPRPLRSLHDRIGLSEATDDDLPTTPALVGAGSRS